MAKEVKRALSASDLVRNSLLYQHFQAELEEIDRHKWYESEKAGHDIGFARALTQWTMKHRSGWLRHRQRREETTAFCRVRAMDLRAQ